MQNIDASERPKIGDEVVTAGIELAAGIRSPYPKGLLIGQIVDVRRDANAVVQTAYLEPAVDLDKLEVPARHHELRRRAAGRGSLPTDQTNPDGTLPDSEQPFVTPAPTIRPSPKASPTKKP